MNNQYVIVFTVVSITVTVIWDERPCSLPFRRKILLPSSALKLEVEGFGKRMVNFSSTTRRYFREESNLQICLGSLEEGRETAMLCVHVLFHLCFSSGWIIFRHISFSIYLSYRAHPKRIRYDIWNTFKCISKYRTFTMSKNSSEISLNHLWTYMSKAVHIYICLQCGHGPVDFRNCQQQIAPQN